MKFRLEELALIYKLVDMDTTVLKHILTEAEYRTAMVLLEKFIKAQTKMEDMTK